MAVKMRLTRLGDKKSPTYRIVVVDSRKARDGEYIDKVGHYNPTANPAEVVIDADKAKDWLSKGVQPTETVRALLLNAGVIEKSEKLSPSKTNPKKKKKEFLSGYSSQIAAFLFRFKSSMTKEVNLILSTKRALLFERLSTQNKFKTDIHLN